MEILISKSEKTITETWVETHNLGNAIVHVEQRSVTTPFGGLNTLQLSDVLQIIRSLKGEKGFSYKFI